MLDNGVAGLYRVDVNNNNEGSPSSSYEPVKRPRKDKLVGVRIGPKEHRRWMVFASRLEMPLAEWLRYLARREVERQPTSTLVG